MKIKICESGGFKLTLVFPLSFARWKIWYKVSGQMKYFPISKKICGALRSYVKNNGHFVLVDVEDNDGSKVKIIV